MSLTLPVPQTTGFPTRYTDAVFARDDWCSRLARYTDAKDDRLFRAFSRAENFHCATQVFVFVGVFLAKQCVGLWINHKEK